MRLLSPSSTTLPPVAALRRLAGALLTCFAALTVAHAQSSPPSTALILAPTAGTATGITGTPTDVAVNAKIGVTAAPPNGTSAPSTITLNIKLAPIGPGSTTLPPTGGTPSSSAPVVADAAVSGQVGLTIRPVQVQARGSPTIFNAPGLLSLAPGQYSAVVTGANGASGAALVEVYDLP